ncbi:hypothetical protein C798_25240 [Herbaspirillum rubrisubalbicans Os34]|uniref:Uncharacterized protein n=1 Tax=Herbaspirillum rubrisubalbicans Os34 TaxID=1235827 RepID=A0A6M3ZXM0_9BURK|nr:hypothetical protein [Herbaspirillum rubrisubalbicans]QJQ03419.1 hypothetical protein C798_25240 [Herbaspirillum rubrisubalbicans Os34]
MITKVKHRLLRGHLYLRARPESLDMLRVRDIDAQNAYLMCIGTLQSSHESNRFVFKPLPMTAAAGSLFSMSLQSIEKEERKNTMVRAGKDVSILPEMTAEKIHDDNRIGFALRTGIARYIDSEGGIDLYKSVETYTRVVAYAARLYDVSTSYAYLCYETYLFYGRHEYALINDISLDDGSPEGPFDYSLHQRSIPLRIDSGEPCLTEFMQRRKDIDFWGFPAQKGRLEQIYNIMRSDLSECLNLRPINPKSKRIGDSMYMDHGPQKKSRFDQMSEFDLIMHGVRESELSRPQKERKDKKC